MGVSVLENIGHEAPSRGDKGQWSELVPAVLAVDISIPLGYGFLYSLCINAAC